MKFGIYKWIRMGYQNWGIDPFDVKLQVEKTSVALTSGSVCKLSIEHLKCTYKNPADHSENSEHLKHTPTN